MRCPRCGFDGELMSGGCARCGYGRISEFSGSVSGRSSALSVAVQRSSPTQQRLPMPVTDPLRLSVAQMRERSRRKSLLNVGIFAAVCVLLLIIFLFAIMR